MILSICKPFSIMYSCLCCNYIVFTVCLFYLCYLFIFFFFLQKISCQLGVNYFNELIQLYC